jgi:uncharacterized protein YlxP (DUF503 family)
MTAEQELASVPDSIGRLHFESWHRVIPDSGHEAAGIRRSDMPIVYCTLDLFLPFSQSLKEKRMILRKAQDRLRARSNFSVAEVDHQDLWQRAKLAAVTVGSDNATLERVTQQFVREAQDILGDILVDCQVTYIEP